MINMHFFLIWTCILTLTRGNVVSLQDTPGVADSRDAVPYNQTGSGRCTATHPGA